MDAILQPNRTGALNPIVQLFGNAVVCTKRLYGKSTALNLIETQILVSMFVFFFLKPIH